LPELPAADASLQARASANVAEALRTIARHDPCGTIEEADGLTLIATSIPYPLFNAAFLSRPVTDVAALAERVRRFYARAGVPGLLLAATDEAVARAAPLIQAAGMTPGDPIPGMLLAPFPTPPPLPADLEIKAVEDPAMLRVYNDTLAAGYGLPRDWLAAFDRPETLAIQDMAFYLGFLAGEAVATALRFTSHRIAGIYNVATLPAYRRRGIGAALTWRAALDGRAEGCLASALQSSEQGFPVYQRMGYRHVVDYRTWVIQEADHALSPA
jgi:GNAT superfamily N-acetyltransferase